MAKLITVDLRYPQIFFGVLDFKTKVCNTHNVVNNNNRHTNIHIFVLLK